MTTASLRLRPQYRAVIVEGRGALLLSDRGDRALKGRLFERLIPLIDGGSSAAEVATRLEPEHSPAEVFYSLTLLQAQGFLTSETLPGPLPAPVPLPAPRVPPLPMKVMTLGDLPVAACLEALARRGILADQGAAFTLALSDSYLRPELATLDAEVRAAGGDWVPARLAADTIWVGPVFRSGAAPCWRCLEHRLARNRPFEYHLLRYPEGAHPLGSSGPEGAALEAAIAAVAGVGAAAIGPKDDVGLARSILAIDLASGAVRRHPVARRPQCPVCGDPEAYAREAGRPILLRSGRRETSTEATLVRFGALVDPLTGVVHSAEPVMAAPLGPVHVWAARFGATPAGGNGPLLELGLRQSAGKGIGEAQAHLSCLGEAIERASWAYQGDEPRRLASLEELGADAIHPNACMLFSDAQYAARSALDPAAPRWRRVPPPLDPRARIEWTAVWSPVAQQPRYLPTMLLYGGYSAPPDLAYYAGDPSGSAAGNSLEEAVLQGTLELVERDALAIWWYNRVRRPAVALDAAADPWIGRLVAWHESRGRGLWALDLTTDLGIPVVAAVSRRSDGGAEAPLFGFGAHLDPGVALTRALLELAQIDAQVARADEEGRALDPTLAAWLRDATLAGQPYLVAAPGPAAALPELATDDLREAIAICRRALARAGIDLYILDQTRPDIGVPVVKVVAPGLRPFRPRFAPGRLYDVPVRLGWLAEPRAETDLNPIPFFL
jgi:ribosomal protein S12 methylthiotransferase accessory factor